MIAKSNSLFKYLLLLVILLANIPIAKANSYQNIAAEYTIKSAPLPYGYPLWYDADNSKTAAIIFLTNEIDYLNKINGKTYVAQPTLINAKEIRAFCPEGIYYLHVDSNVAVEDFKIFTENLALANLADEYRIVDSFGRFVSIYFYNDIDNTREDGVVGCFFRPRSLNINFINDDITFVGSERTRRDSIWNQVYTKFNVNRNFDKDYDSPYYYRLSTKELQSKINELEKLDPVEGDNAEFLKKFIEKKERSLYLMKKYVSALEMGIMKHHTLSIQLPERGSGTLSCAYSIYNQVQKGFAMTLNYTSIRLFNKSYMELISARKFEMIELVQLIHPVHFINHRIDSYGRLPLVIDFIYD